MFQIGVQVQITGTQYLFGEIGIIDRVFHKGGETIYGVYITDRPNPRSKHGLFWLRPNNLTIYKEDCPMNPTFATAMIHFLSGSNVKTEYAYALYDPAIVPGDTVVVNTGHHGLAVAQVSSIGETSGEAVRFGREVVCKVDLTKFKERKEKARRIAKLERDMYLKAAEVQATVLYELLAEKNPELRVMLDEYKSLTDTSEGRCQEEDSGTS